MKTIVWLLLAVSIPAMGQEVRRALPVNASEKPDEIAKFLAGVPLQESSALAPLQNTADYRAHVEALAKLTRHYDQNFFSKMRAWSSAELAPRLAMGRPVFYFFGGPDAVSAMAMYPEAPTYILGGLESVGQVAAPQTLSAEDLSASLANLRKSTEVILSYGHFITKDMKAELDRTGFRGVLPLLFLFVSLSGGEVLSAEFIGIRAGGIEGPWTPGEKALPGVKVIFRAGPGRPDQTLFYVQANVADEALKSNNDILAWAGRFGQGNVYLKAASYLMHEGYFSKIRTFLLGTAASVLQDDSGIPLSFFRDGTWQLMFFGTYSGTLEIFQKYHQPDLQAAFSSPGLAMPLPFGTGYKWRPGESNLMLAVRLVPGQLPDPPRAIPVSPQN